MSDDETASEAPKRAPRTGLVLANRYRLGPRLGMGGMGEVYEAEHLEIPRRFAIKLLRADHVEDAQMRERFRGEARAAASLSSDHIVQVIDFGQADDGSPYLVMELLEGSDLRRVFKERGPLACKEAIEIVMQACEGAHVAHQQSIVHRDLKPENLFLARRGEQRSVKVLDFGIAKLRAHSVSTANGKLLGTPAYMSPEQARGGAEVDARTDVYALGVILYEALSARLPHPGEGAHEIISHLLFNAADPLTHSRPELPRALCEVVHKALSREPAARYQTVVELRAALAPLRDVPLREGRSALSPPAPLELHETLPARDSEVRSEFRPSAEPRAATPVSQLPPESGGSAFSRARRALALGGVVSSTALSASLVFWLARPASRSVETQPRSSDRAPVSREQASAPLPAQLHAPVAAPVAAVALAPAASAAGDAATSPGRSASGARRRTETAPVVLSAAPDTLEVAPQISAADAGAEPATFEVKRGEQTIVFKRDNPLRR